MNRFKNRQAEERDSKKRNIKIVVRVVIVIAVAIQFARFDNLIVTNYQNEGGSLNKGVLDTKMLTTHFEEDDRYTIAYDSSEEESLDIAQNTERVLKQLKKQYSLQDLKVPKSIEFSNHETTILLVIRDLSKVKNLSDCVGFVREGGNLVFLEAPDQSPSLDSVKSRMGIIDSGNKTTTEGIKFNEDFIPGYKTDEIKSNIVKNFVIPVTLDEDCKIYMRSSTDVPLLWTRKLGLGRITVFNATMTRDKIMIGFLTRALAVSEESYLYPIINSKVFYLDDFPAPMSNGYFPEIKKMYNKSIKEFYIDIWWPEMLELSKKYDFKYTGAMIQVYNNSVHEPFEYDGELEDSELVVLGRELLRSGGELGLHGYNHQSLTTEGWKSDALGYNKWTQKKDMVTSLKVVKAKLDRVFPNYKITAYVPPSNVIDNVGISAVKEVFKDLTSIGSVYYEDYEGLNYSQEFSVSEDHVVNLPRFSAGYNFGMDNRLAVLNGILGVGLVSHFIHPDDFMDSDRSEGKKWPEQLESFEYFVETIDRHYGFLKAETASEAAQSIIKYVNLDYTTKYTDEGIEVHTNGVAFPMYMFLHSEKEINKGTKCEIRKFGEKDYIVIFSAKDFSIEYKR